MAAHDRRRGKGRDSSGHVDSFADRRKRYETVLRAVDAWDAFAAMPRPFQHMFWKLKLPDPQVVFDETVPTDGEDGAIARDVRKRVETALREATVEVAETKLQVRDYIAVLGGMVSMIQHVPAGFLPKVPDVVVRFFRDVGPRVVKAYEDHWQKMIESAYEAVRVPVMANGRIERFVLSSKMEPRVAERTGKQSATIVIGAARPEQRRVSIEGKPRTMYRVAQALGSGITWVSWKDPAAADGEPELPIFVQGHALRRLRERVNLPGVEPYLEAWMSLALDKPVVVERQGADLLVEFRIEDSRLGYLILSPLHGQGCMAVRTFKFLTMQNTPEGRRLERRLRLSRMEVSWLRLNEIQSFTHTDLRTDPQLRTMMEECGCGQLFTFAEKEDFAPKEPKALAAEVRKYLRMAA